MVSMPNATVSSSPESGPRQAALSPYLARLQEALPNFELRVLSRDENPDLMDAHLTNGTRSIPVVMILDQEFREVAWWGPRPRPLQELFHR